MRFLRFVVDADRCGGDRQTLPTALSKPEVGRKGYFHDFAARG
jgi:hypothetical protein